MSWQVKADWYSTSELNGISLHGQRVRFNRDIVLRGIRTWFVLYNDPVFTDLSLRIYSDRSGSPGKLITTSSAVTKAELISLANGCKEAFWELDLPTFKGTDWFHIVPVASGYTGTSTSHIAWRKGWPDAVYTTGLTPTYTNWPTQPYMIYFIGDDL